jgi:SAM-dependent methyltransferase
MHRGASLDGEITVSATLLEVPADLPLPPVARAILADVDLGLHREDPMYQGNPEHYLSVGASAYNVIAAGLQLAGKRDIAKILDFGAGAGRVTRWLHAGFPSAAITVADLSEEHLAWLEARFGAKQWVCRSDVARLQAADSYDLVWVGSVLTHLSAQKATLLLQKLLQWTNPSGLVIATTHGRRAVALQDSGRLKYIDDRLWAMIREDYEAMGYGYADYGGQNGYGVSLTGLSWTARLLQSMAGVRLIALSEAVWDDHHDVIAIQKL